MLNIMEATLYEPNIGGLKNQTEEVRTLIQQIRGAGLYTQGVAGIPNAKGIYHTFLNLPLPERYMNMLSKMENKKWYNLTMNGLKFTVAKNYSGAIVGYFIGKEETSAIRVSFSEPLTLVIR